MIIGAVRMLLSSKYHIEESTGDKIMKIGQYLAKKYGQSTIAFLGPPCIDQAVTDIATAAVTGHRSSSIHHHHHHHH